MHHHKYWLLLFITLILGMACKSRTPLPMKTYTILGLGDSYTFGQNVDTSQRYLSQLYTQLAEKKYKVAYPKIIAATGWTTHNLLDNIALDSSNKKYDFVFLLIGVNNEYQQQAPSGVYRAEFVTCLENALTKAGGKASNVFVISIPDYSVTRSQNRKAIPNATSIRLDAYNKINKEEALLKNVNYVEITEDSRLAYNDMSLIATDGLHPSGKMYGQWVAKILPIIEKKMQL